MKNIKYFGTLMIIITCFFLFPVNGEASKKNPGEDVCIKDGTCMKVCEWNNNGKHIYAYYFFDYGIWKYDWDNGRLLDVKDSKFTFYENKDLMETRLFNSGECPIGAYVDTSGGIFNQDEVCFDSTEKVSGERTHCENVKSYNASTSFYGPTSLVYSANKAISDYFDNYVIAQKINCESIADESGYAIDMNKVKPLFDQINLDLNNKFFHGNAMPTFIQNSGYDNKYKEFREKFTLSINACDVQLKQKANDDLTNGTISKNEYNNVMQNRPNVEDQINGQFNNFEQNLTGGNNGSNSGEVVDASCNSLLGEKITSYLKMALTILQIAGVILAIILGMVDFLGAMLSGEADANKKAFNKFKIRLIMAAILFLAPALLKFLLGTFGLSEYGNSFCIL